jgi:hypothetical protein
MRKIVENEKKWYPCICGDCGYIGSSEYFGEDYGDGDDTDVICPRCGSFDTAEYGCNHYPPLHWLTDLICRYKAWSINKRRERYCQEGYEAHKVETNDKT